MAAGTPREEVVSVLGSVGFTDAMQQQSVGSLSGGWKMKLALGKSLSQRSTFSSMNWLTWLHVVIGIYAQATSSQGVPVQFLFGGLIVSTKVVRGEICLIRRLIVCGVRCPRDFLLCVNPSYLCGVIRLFAASIV